MSRLLAATVTLVVIAACFAGFASARLATPAAATDSRASDPFRTPVELPTAVDGHAGIHGFASEAQVVRSMRVEDAGDTSDAAAAAAPAGSASITITATVLPVVTVVLEGDGTVSQLLTNSAQRDGRLVLYAFRSGDVDGPLVAPTAESWTAARGALAAARAGTGTVFAA